jgi:hypothetical protein
LVIQIVTLVVVLRECVKLRQGIQKSLDESTHIRQSRSYTKANLTE